MNQRIYELASQAGMAEGFGPEVWQTTFTDRFAELIVRECSVVARNTNLEDVEGGDSAVLREVAKQIQKHFGVE